MKKKLIARCSKCKWEGFDSYDTEKAGDEADAREALGELHSLEGPLDCDGFLTFSDDGYYPEFRNNISEH